MEIACHRVRQVARAFQRGAGEIAVDRPEIYRGAGNTT
jgi:hypothetical protein